MTRGVEGFQAVPNDDLAFLGTDPVPAAPYYDHADFERERDAIFRRTWLHVGRESEVAEPNSFIVRSIEMARASVLITRSSDGLLRAFHNVCSHRGTQLVWEDSGRAGSFSCHYHMWNYGNDGSLRLVPDEQRFFSLDKAACGLRPVAVETCAGFVFVNFDPLPEQTLREFLGPIADELEGLELGRFSDFCQYSYEVDANWKTAFDNFQETYHLRWVHAPSSGGSATSPDNPFGYPTAYRFSGLHRSMTLWMRPDPDLREVQRKAMTSAVAAASTAPGRSSREFYCLFPNIFIAPMGGRSCFTQQVWPVGPERSRAVVRVYWEGADWSASTRFSREYSTASVLDVHVEDRELIEASQRGLRSGALEHLHFQAQESLCRHFHLSVQGMVNAHIERSGGASRSALR